MKLKTVLTVLSAHTAAAVGTAWCVVLFLALGILSAPGVGPDWLNAWANWLDQALLPLVLMPVLLIATNIAAEVISALITETHRNSAAALADLTEIADALHVHATGESHPAARKDDSDAAG